MMMLTKLEQVVLVAQEQTKVGVVLKWYTIFSMIKNTKNIQIFVLHILMK